MNISFGDAPLTPQVFLTLRAHRPAPARVELKVRSRARRFIISCAWLLLCWGTIPFLLRIPPHYPWVVIALLVGTFLARENWKARYDIQSFAGVCPRCGSGISMSGGHRLSLPYTLTCFHCHFEPRLEACLPRYATGEVRLEHQTDCVGLWELLWLADERFLYCPLCHGGTPANEALMARAEAENEIGKLLAQLTDEGQPLI